jgi:hypothetical protein
MTPGGALPERAPRRAAPVPRHFRARAPQAQIRLQLQKILVVTRRHMGLASRGEATR